MDLFVRVSNNVAVNMYNSLGYSVYRRVLEYYSGDPDEDAFGKARFFVYFYANTSIFHIYYKWNLLKIIVSIVCVRHAQGSFS